MTLANKIPQKSDDQATEKRSFSRLYNTFDDTLDSSPDHYLQTRTIRRRNCVIPTNTKASSSSCVAMAKKKGPSTKPLKQEDCTDTKNKTMLRSSSRHEKQNAQETPNFDGINSSSACSTENISSSSELETMRKTQMNHSWYTIHVAMQSQTSDNAIKSKRQEQQPNATFNDDMSSPLKDLDESEYSSEMEIASQTQMKCSWYDAQRATEERFSVSNKDTEDEEGNDIDADNTDHICAKEISDMLRKYEPVQLWKTLLAVQQQLQCYHSLLDAHEESKSKNIKLEKKVGKHETKLKKLTHCYKEKRDEVKEMEKQIIQLKVDLAEAKCQNDHHTAQVRRLSADKKMLEEENDGLRRFASASSTTTL